jgi:hypothetical protein
MMNTPTHSERPHFVILNEVKNLLSSPSPIFQLPSPTKGKDRSFATLRMTEWDALDGIYIHVMNGKT